MYLLLATNRKSYIGEFSALLDLTFSEFEKSKFKVTEILKAYISQWSSVRAYATVEN